MANAGKDHREVQSVRRVNYVLIADATTGLNDRRGARFGYDLKAIWKREEGI